MSEFLVKKQITIDANPHMVWKALTDPEWTKKYFFGCSVFSDWHAGSVISFKRKFLWKNIELNGKILQIEPEKLLLYTLKNSGSNGFSVITDTLSFVNGKTILSITDDVGATEGAEKRFKRSDKGWDRILTGLKKEVEKNKIS